MPEPSGRSDAVVLRLPAHARSLPVARTAAAAVTSQWGFGLDVVDDARLIVSELFTHVLQTKPGCLTQLTLSRDANAMYVALHTQEPLPTPVVESFGWLVVSELTSELVAHSDDAGLTITAALTSTGSPG